MYVCMSVCAGDMEDGAGKEGGRLQKAQQDWVQ